MPLDAQYKATLTDIVQWSGISPVPHIVLEQHKQAEINKHPASWAFKNVKYIRLILAVSPVVYSIAVVTLPPLQLLSLVGPFLMGLALLSLFSIANIRFKGPAKWSETFKSSDNVMNDASIPAPIREIATDLLSLVPNSWFVVGELVQQKIVLDPYLIMFNGDESICLGVWDGDTIIHIAQRA